MSIGTLLAMPAAKGLFQKAILQSGASQTILDSARASRIATKLMDTLGIHSITDLLDVSSEQLLAAQNKISGEGRQLAFQPVVDGASLPQQSIEAIANGSASDVSLLIGTIAMR